MNELRPGPILTDETATEALGGRLGLALRHLTGGVIYLTGDLGAGKTTLARGWLRALGVQGTIRSPTYTLVELYELAERTLLHLDLYRLNDPSELEQLGLADTPPQIGGWLVEWPERGGSWLPLPSLHLHLAQHEDRRRLSWWAQSEWADSLRATLETT